MQQKVLRQPRIDQRIPLILRKLPEHPHAQQRPNSQSRHNRQGRAQGITGFGHQTGQLTLGGVFHTIRTV